MSWTLTNIQTGFTVTVPNPEPGDAIRTERRQATGETEGGRAFTQDLKRNDFFLEVSFSGLTRCNREDLLAFMGSVTWRATQFKLETTQGGAHVPSNSGGDWSGRVRLDQSRLSFRIVNPDAVSNGQRELYETTMRFRVFPVIEIVVQDVIQALDSVSLGGSTLSLGLPVDAISAADTVSVVLS